MAPLDEDTVDEILYLARVNEVTELGSLFSELSAQTKLSTAELSALSVDSETKNSALHYAAANGHLDVIKLLFSYSTDKPAPQLINAANDAGNTPLHWAALNGRLECVQLLIESGADVTIINQAGHDAVFEAEINDKKEVVDWLLGAVEELEKGIGEADDVPENMAADVDDSNKQGSTTETGTVEDVRKQMEEMKTGNAVSKDG